MTGYLSMERNVGGFGGREEESFIADAHSGCQKITRHPCSFVMRELMRLVSTRIKDVYSKNYPSRTWRSILACHASPRERILNPDRFFKYS